MIFQTYFSWDIDRYRDTKKKLINFEKSILKPWNLSLYDDLELIKTQLDEEKIKLEEKKQELNNEENKNKLIEKYSKEIIELSKKKKPLNERVKQFASLNNKCLSEMLQYDVVQKNEVKIFNERIEAEKIQSETLEIQEIKDAIEGLKILLDIEFDKKEKRSIKDAIEGLKLLL